MPKDQVPAQTTRHRSTLDTGRIGRPPLEPQIKRFTKEARKRLRKLARSAPQFGDLLFSFPAAAYAIAVGGPGSEARAVAVAAVKAGASLSVVGEALGLPNWCRRLPPECFEGPLEPMEPRPDLARFVANATPNDPVAAGPWFSAVRLGAHLVSSRFAGWLARSKLWSRAPRAALAATLPIAAYAWHGARVDDPTRRFMSRSWTKEMSLPDAAREARLWLERLSQHVALEPTPSTMSWLRPQRCGGYHIVPLRVSELYAEGERMHNCLATYQVMLETGRCLLYAVRRGNRSVASLELRANPLEPGAATIVQLEGPSNSHAPHSVCVAVKTWIARQGPFPLKPQLGLRGRALDPDRWQSTWAPFAEEVGADYAGPFAATPTVDVLSAIDLPLIALDRF